MTNLVNQSLRFDIAAKYKNDEQDQHFQGNVTRHEDFVHFTLFHSTSMFPQFYKLRMRQEEFNKIFRQEENWLRGSVSESSFQQLIRDYTDIAS